MKVTIGHKGCDKSHQDKFPELVQCVHCGCNAHIAFVSHEGFEKDEDDAVCTLARKHPYSNGKLWLHDYSSFATYVCTECLKATTILNQA